MNAYQQAFETWESQGEEGIQWNDLLSYFLNDPDSALVSTPDSFVLARRIHHGATDEEQNRLSPLQYQGALDCWNVWLAAGRLDSLLLLLKTHPLPWISYCRRGKSTVRRVKLETLLRHEPQSTTSTAASTAPGFRDRT